MEINPQNLQALAACISQTLSPDMQVRKPAEKYLESVEGNQNYPLLLLHLVQGEQGSAAPADTSIRVAGAIAFKNFVRRNWSPADQGGEENGGGGGDSGIGNRIHPVDREAIKREIINLMLSSPSAIQRQLSDAISIIGRYDFPAKWPSLMTDLVAKLATEDFHVINGILRTAHSLFKRYRFEFKSDRLWGEIKLVLDQFAPALTQLFLSLMGLAQTHAGNKEAITIIYASLLLVSKIFYSLNAQEIPEFFEDNIKTWMPNFHTLLTTENPLLKTGDDEEEPGLLEQIRSQICDNVGMYARKYDEEFEEFLPLFVTDIWGLLVTTGSATKYDSLVSNAIQFLALVAEKDRNKGLFSSGETMSGICQKVLLPNMEFRAADEELFEDNPEEYIRRDIEGSDVDTRRRAVCDLVRALSKHFEVDMTAIFGAYVQEMLGKYGANPKGEWKAKDAAIYLVTSIVAKGQTQKDGVTKTSALVSVQEFYDGHILPELKAPNVNELPVLKADGIKYLMTFRSQLSPTSLREGIPHLVRFLGAESPVISSYAASCIEKLLLLKQSDNNAPLISGTDLSPVGGPLISALFAVLGKPTTKENEYVMKALMRSTSALQEAIIPLMGGMWPSLLEHLKAAARNPSKPHFNHYLFETLALCIRILCKADGSAVGQCESDLFQIFQTILQQDVAEFVPYVFQLLALMLNVHPSEGGVGGGASPGVSDAYMALFPCLLSPALWEKHANIPPLTQLIQVYVRKGAGKILATDKLGAVLGVFQKLIASKTHDHEGFNLVRTLVDVLPPNAMAQYLKNIYFLLFQRLTSSKTTKFVKGLLLYSSTYINRYGAEGYIAMMDSIEEGGGFMAKVLDRIWIPELQKMSGQQDKRVVGVGVTRLLCEAPGVMLTGQYAMYWTPLLQALIQMFECPEDAGGSEVLEHFAEIEEISSYQANYAKLNFGSIPLEDPLKESVPDVRLFLAASLSKLSVGNPGKLTTLTATISPDAQNCLARYLAAANLQIY